eukprot:1159108-Pelagomonas_calceolata.AAC.4
MEPWGEVWFAQKGLEKLERALGRCIGIECAFSPWDSLAQCTLLQWGSSTQSISTMACVRACERQQDMLQVHTCFSLSALENNMTHHETCGDTT